MPPQYQLYTDTHIKHSHSLTDTQTDTHTKQAPRDAFLFYASQTPKPATGNKSGGGTKKLPDQGSREGPQKT